MSRIVRREFLKTSGLALAGFSMDPVTIFPKIMQSNFKLSLHPGAIGVVCDHIQLLDYAKRFKFDAITPLIDDLNAISSTKRKAYVKEMKRNNLSWDAAGLPVQFRSDERSFKMDLDLLKGRCEVLAEVGVSSMNTWIMPTHSSLTYRQNFDLHVFRLSKIANIISNFNIKLGLEYVGPKTLMTSEKYSFIRTLSEVTELVESIDHPSIAYQLDSFHFYCAKDSLADLAKLKPANIVTVDLNDAVIGRTADDQLDWERALPLATGVIDLKPFLATLRDIGYKGPIRAEPFNKTLNAMNDEKAIELTIKSLRKSVALI
ncbi:MAG: 2-keto-myo-inositol isomerase [Cyclobacteriaceae bacterium]|jgi:sugar phosphate isomerase/epimerase